MGYGTIWTVGCDSDARLIYQGNRPDNLFSIEVKFITRVELQILRCRLHNLPAFDPKVDVYDLVFPQATDPEWEEWYQSVGEGGFGGVDGVLPEFLAELRVIKPSEIPQLGADWGIATEGGWHKTWPDHATWALGELIRTAVEAEKRNMRVFATEFF